MAKEYKVKTLKNGEKRYIFDISLGYKADGKRIRTTISAKNIKEGRKKVAELRLKINKPTSNDSEIFESAYSYYIKYCTDIGMRETTLYNKKHVYYKNFSYFYGMKMSKIKETDIDEWRNNLKKTLSDSTVNTRECALNAFLTWCVRKNIIEVNPFTKLIKTPMKRKNELNFWTEKEFKDFIDKVTYEEHKKIFTTLFYTGLRKSELFGLKYSDIHGHELHLTETVKRNGSTYVVEDKFKNDQSKRIVPIPKWLDLGSGEGYIFRPTKYCHINRDFDNWIMRTGTKRIRIHDLRHSYVAMLINKGVDIYTISKIVGHSSIKTTLDTYGHLYDTKRKKISDLL